MEVSTETGMNIEDLFHTVGELNTTCSLYSSIRFQITRVARRLKKIFKDIIQFFFYFSLACTFFVVSDS